MLAANGASAGAVLEVLIHSTEHPSKVLFEASSLSFSLHARLKDFIAQQRTLVFETNVPFGALRTPLC